MATKSLVKIKPKTYKVGDVVEVSLMVMHPMETGLRKDKETGNLIPAHYINDVKFSFNGTPFTTIKSWESLSTNPVYTVSYKVSGEGEIKVAFTDTKGEANENGTKIKPKA